MPKSRTHKAEARDVAVSRVAFGVIGIGALVLAVLLPTDTLLTPVRAILAIAGAFLIPGGVLVRFVSKQGRWPTIIVESIVMSMALFVIGTFLLTIFGVRLTTLWYFIVPVVGTGVALVVGRGEQASSVLPSPLMWTVGLIVCALGSAGISHVVLPAPSPESSFSIFVPRVLLATDARSFTIPIRINRVSYVRPINLDVQIDFISVGHIHIASDQSRMVATVDLLSPAPCRRDLVELVGPDGQTLTPPVSCLMKSATSG